MDSDFPEWLLVLIILTLPLQVSKTLFPIQQIEISRLLMGVAFVWMAMRGRSRGWPFPRSLSLAIGATLLLLVGSFVPTRWEQGVLLVLAPLYYAAFAAFVAMTVRDRVAVTMVAVAMLAAGVYVSILGIALDFADAYLWRDGVFGTLGRANATFWDPNIAARFLNITVIVLLAVVTVVRLPDRRRGVAIAACMVLFGIAMVLTQSRFGWITAILMLPLAILAFRPRRWVTAFSGLFLAAFVLTVAVNGTAASRAGELAAGVSYTLGADVPIEMRGNMIGLPTTFVRPAARGPGPRLLRAPADRRDPVLPARGWNTRCGKTIRSSGSASAGSVHTSLATTLISSLATG